jgi:hypothetical protein
LRDLLLFSDVHPERHGGKGETWIASSRRKCEHDATVLGLRDGVGLRIDGGGDQTYFRSSRSSAAWSRSAGCAVATSSPEENSLLADLGVAADDGHRLTPAALADFEPLSMLQESCLVFNAAFILLVAGWAIVGFVLLLRRRRPQALAR